MGGNGVIKVCEEGVIQVCEEGIIQVCEDRMKGKLEATFMPPRCE